MSAGIGSPISFAPIRFRECVPVAFMRATLIWLTLTVPLVSAGERGSPSGPATNPTAAETADLKERLEKDLRARLPDEFAFIAKVVELVEAGTLPVDLVESTYLWARRQRLHPFQHFERGLRVRAGRLGINL